MKTERMPVLFTGHGSPMNAIEDNAYTAQWEQLGRTLPRPRAILSISAHWYTRGTLITDAPEPRMIYDMYGFPKALYQVQYPAPGHPALAHEIQTLLTAPVTINNDWGCDHGTWSVLCRMFPEADIPVLQLSVDGTKPAAYHYQIGQELASLREDGVLILGSGNVVHNLSMVDWSNEGGFDWAQEFDDQIHQSITDGNHENVIHWENAGSAAKAAVPTPDHYLPLLYVLGASSAADEVRSYNRSCVLGSLSMTGYLLGQNLPEQV